MSIHQSLKVFSPGFPKTASINLSAAPPLSGSTISYRAFKPAPNNSSNITPDALTFIPIFVAAKFTAAPNLAAKLSSEFIIVIKELPSCFTNSLYSDDVKVSFFNLVSILFNTLSNVLSASPYSTANLSNS